MKKINKDYLKLWEEIPILLLIEINSFFPSKTKTFEKRILIADAGLAGEFAMSIPAIVDFIKRNNDYKVDILVAPQDEPIAKHIKGIEEVFVANSVYKRDSETSMLNSYKEIVPNHSYEKVVVLRGSRGTLNFIKKIETGEVTTSAIPMIFHGAKIFKGLVLRETQEQQRVFNFKVLGGIPKEIPFEEIFNVSDDEINFVKNLDGVNSKNKKIIIHTDSKWVMRKWGNDKWIQLLEKINKTGNFDFIYVGGRDDDVTDFNQISSGVDFKIYSLVSKIDLFELLLVMHYYADYFIGIDSGPGNLAHIANLRSIVIFGPGPHRYMPYNKEDVVLDRSNGRGLYQHFFFKEDSFINKISVDDVYDAFVKLSNK